MAAPIASNKAIAMRFFELMLRGKSDRLADLIAPDFRIWSSGELWLGGWASRNEFLDYAAGGGGANPMFSSPMRLDFGPMTAEGDRVCVESEAHASLTEGGEYNNHFHFSFRIRDGLIIEMKEFMDTLHVYQRIAVTRAPHERLATGRQSPLTEITASISSDDEID